MSSSIPAAAPPSPPVPAGARARAVSGVRAALEGVVLLMVCAAPWCYGAVHPGFEFLLLAGVGLVLVLWAARMLLEGCLSWKKCPVALCLAGLFLLGVWQITSLSRSVLSLVSPSTAALYDQLLPAQPESLAVAEDSAPAAAAPGSTISLYPTATRLQLVRLLAVFLLFAAVRNNVRAEAGLRRLSVAAVLNGSALSLFALCQFYSSPPDVLYWSHPSLGQVFGPFICRNHFPFYVNLCIGLGVGLLLSRTPGSGRRSRRRSSSRESDRPDRGWLTAPFGLLQDPATLWVCAGLALMVGTVARSMSRGGMLALGGGAVVCLLLRLARPRESGRGGAVVVIAGLAVMLASWLGFGLIQERLASVVQAEAIQSRWTLWTRMAPLAKDFPVWGTGLGTFTHTECLEESSAEDVRYVAEHAHNDYLEVLLEGGVPGLVLGVLTVVLVFRLGWKALRRGNRASQGLALGALFGFTTLVIQSFGDFGLHIPAIALLATVVSAHLVTLGQGSSQEVYRLRLGGVGPLVGAVTCGVLGLVLTAYGWRAHRVDRLRTAAQEAGADGLTQRIAYLEAAVWLAPQSAEVQLELGRARLRLFEKESGRLERRGAQDAAAGALLSARGDWPAALGWFLTTTAERDHRRGEQKQLDESRLLPALRSYLNARDRCPTLAEPNLVLASQGAGVRGVEPREVYLARVKRLSNGEAQAWYLCGAQEMLAKEPASARASWRRCLELSDRFLPHILEANFRDLDSAGLIELVLPDRPEELLSAALYLYPESGAGPERRPFLEKAVRLLDARAGSLKPEDLYVKAVCLKHLGQPDEAITAYRAALAGQPDQAEWRCEMAQVMHARGQLEEARRQVVLVLAQQPLMPQARELMAAISHDLARQK